MKKDTRNEEILQMNNDGVKQKLIAEKYDISIRTVQRIVKESEPVQELKLDVARQNDKYSVVLDDKVISTSNDILDFQDIVGVKFSSGRLNHINERLNSGETPIINGYEIHLNDIQEKVEKTKHELEQDIKDLKCVLSSLIQDLDDRNMIGHYKAEELKKLI
jgi:hypothetical protein